MKNFREFINEEMMPYAQVEKGFVGVDNGPVRDNINIHLTAITAKPYATPYHALEMIRKVLAPFHIGLPSTNFLSGDSGHEIFEINQFGERTGMKNNGDVVTTTGSSYFVYFEYAMNDIGSFDIFSEIVNQEELDEILSDIEDEMEEGDEGYYSHEADGSDSFDSYKSGNMNENWGDKPPKSEREGYAKDPSDGKWKPSHKIGRPVKKVIKKKEKLDEVSSEYLDKKIEKYPQIMGRYAGKQQWDKVDKVVRQVEKMQKYMQKKGMKSKARDENQERYDSLQYKGD